MNLRKNFQPLLKQLLPHFCKQLFFAARYLNLRHAESLRGLGLGKSPEIAKLQKSAVIRFKTLHYLPQGKQGSVYVQQDGKWIKVPTDTFGSYITFTAAGTEIVMAFVPKGIPLWELCGGTVVALLVAAFLARKLIHKRKARKAKKNAAPVEELDTPIESDDQSTEQHTK